MSNEFDWREFILMALFIFNAILLGVFLPHPQTLTIDCTNAPTQYKAAGEWIDAGHRVKCGEGGEKHYLFYGDAQIDR